MINLSGDQHQMDAFVWANYTLAPSRTASREGSGSHRRQALSVIARGLPGELPAINDIRDGRQPFRAGPRSSNWSVGVNAQLVSSVRSAMISEAVTGSRSANRGASASRRP